MSNLVKSPAYSVMERSDGIVTVYDPQTAHSRAGDPGQQKALPETCAQCLAIALSTAEAEAWPKVGVHNGEA